MPNAYNMTLKKSSESIPLEFNLNVFPYRVGTCRFESKILEDLFKL